MRKFLMLIACMVLLSGCTQSNIVQPDSETRVADPDFEMQEGIEIDWAQVSTEAEEVFEDQGAFPYTRDFHFYLEPNKKEIMLMWIVGDDLPDREIRNYAEELIKGFNDVVAVQDFSIEKSSMDSYGGLWKDYSLSFSIVPESTQDDEETWFMTATFGAGVDFVLPDINALQGNTAAQGTEVALDAELEEAEADGEVSE